MNHGRKHGRRDASSGRVPICICGEKGIYSSMHDAYYCQPGDVWLEEPCSDTTCLECMTRPATPIEHTLSCDMGADCSCARPA